MATSKAEREYIAKAIERDNQRGLALAKLLGIKPDSTGKYPTLHGPKNATGLYNVAVRAITKGI